MTNLPTEALAVLNQERFPLSSKYAVQWVLENEMGPNVLWLTEDLLHVMQLKPGMRVLDMGCGRAVSSIFMAKEFGVQVWANDLWIKPGDNLKRIREAGVEAQVFPIHAEAHALPYAPEFFDAIVSLDSYQYYGTDELYLNYFIRFLKQGGQLGIVVPGLMKEFEKPPEHLTKRQASGSVFWTDDCWSFHTAQWWRRHWARYSGVEVEYCHEIKDGCQLWLQWEEFRNGRGFTGFPSEAEALRADAGQYLGFVCAAARRK